MSNPSLGQKISLAESSLLITSSGLHATPCEIKQLLHDISELRSDTSRLISDESHNPGNVLGDVDVLNGDLTNLLVDTSVAFGDSSHATSMVDIIGCLTSQFVCQPLISF